MMEEKPHRYHQLRFAVTFTTVLIVSTISVVVWRYARINRTKTKEIRSAISNASGLTIYTQDSSLKTLNHKLSFYTTDDPNIINDLSDVFTLIIPNGVCDCIGDMKFAFYKDDKIVLSFTLHHFKTIRISGEPQGDHRLTYQSRNKLLTWFAKNKVFESLKDNNPGTYLRIKPDED